MQHASGRHFSLQHPTPCNCNALQGNRVENLVQAVQALPLYGIEVSPLPLKGSTAGCHPALSACPPPRSTLRKGTLKWTRQQQRQGLPWCCTPGSYPAVHVAADHRAS